jgi:hypothetical protein
VRVSSAWLAGKLKSLYSGYLKSIIIYAMNVRLGCIIMVTDLNYNCYFYDRYARYIHGG